MSSPNSVIRESAYANNEMKSNQPDPDPETPLSHLPRALTSPGPQRPSYLSANKIYIHKLHSSTSVDSAALLDHREQPHSLTSHPEFFRSKRRYPNKHPDGSSSKSSSFIENDEEEDSNINETSQLLPSHKSINHFSPRTRPGTCDVFHAGPSLEIGNGANDSSYRDIFQENSRNFSAQGNDASAPLSSQFPGEDFLQKRDTNSNNPPGRSLSSPHLRTQSRAAEEDVCFPAVPDEVEGTSWPDLEVFEEWTRNELKELNEEIRYDRKLRQRKINEPTLIDGRYRVSGRWVYSKDEDDRPYRFTYFSDELSSTIHSQTFSELCPENSNWSELFKKGELFWLDVNNPTDAEMKMLSKAFSIHPLTTEDISTGETREKVELFRNYYFVCFRSFEQDPSSQDFLAPINMYFVVFRDGVLSFHPSETPHPANVRRRIRQLKDYISVSPDWISYALIDDITDGFGPLIQRIEHEVDAVDDAVLSVSQDEFMLRRIGEARKKVMGLLRLLGNKADVIKGFSKRCNEQWDVAPRSEIGLYLGDIQDHIITMVQNLNHHEKILSRSHSNYLAQISIDMARANNDTNEVLSRLTVLGTILIPMNLITGLWGMNVLVPGQVDDHPTLVWFFSIVGSLVGFAVFSYLVARSYKVF